MKPVLCAICGQLITAALLDERPLPGLVERHQARCLRCQAHGAAIRSTRRVLAGMGPQTVQPPSEVERAVLGTVLVSSPPGLPAGWVPATAATAATVALGLVAAWAWRQRRSNFG